MRKILVLLTAGLLSSSIVFAAKNNFAESGRVMQHKHAQMQNIISINHANAQQLARLKGLGKKRARAIVVYRNQHGPFKTMGDLVKVKGVGKALLQRIHRRNPGKFRLS